jgi:hypothetical protein
MRVETASSSDFVQVFLSLSTLFSKIKKQALSMTAKMIKFSDLPWEIHKLILDKIYEPTIEKFTGLKCFLKVIQNISLYDNLVFARSYDTYRKICKTSSKVDIPRVLWVTAAFSYLRNGDYSNLMSMLSRPAFKQMALPNGNFDKLIMICRKTEFCESIIQISWIKEMILKKVDKYLKSLARWNNHNMYKAIFELANKDPLKDIHYMSDCHDQQIWMIEKGSRSNENMDVARKLLELEKLEPDSPQALAMINEVFRHHFSEKDIRTHSIIEKHGQKRKSPNFEDGLKNSTLKHARVSFLEEHLRSSYPRHMQELGLAVIHGQKAKVDILLPLVESPSEQNNFLFVTAMYQNHLAIAEAIGKHPKFTKGLGLTCKLWMYLVRRRSIEGMDLFARYSNNEDAMRPVWFLRSGLEQVDVLALNKMISLAGTPEKYLNRFDDTFIFIRNVLPLRYYQCQGDKEILMQREILIRLFFCMINPKVDPLFIHDRPHYVLKILRSTYTGGCQLSSEDIICNFRTYINSKKFPLQESLRLMKQVLNSTEISTDESYTLNEIMNELDEYVGRKRLRQ